MILTRQDIEFETGQESYAVHDWADQVVERLHLKFNELKIITTSDRQKFVTFIENNISQIFLIRSFLSCQRNIFLERKRLYLTEEIIKHGHRMEMSQFPKLPAHYPNSILRESPEKFS